MSRCPQPSVVAAFLLCIGGLCSAGSGTPDTPLPTLEKRAPDSPEASVARFKACPEGDFNLRSTDSGERVPTAFAAVPRPGISLTVGPWSQAAILIDNKAGRPVTVYWVNGAGEEIVVDGLGPDETSRQDTMIGHVFRMRTTEGIIMGEFQMNREKGKYTLKPCGESKEEAEAKAAAKAARHAEYEKLTFKRDCKDAGPDSTKWSCVKCLSKEELAARNPREYGFHEGENDERGVGTTWDFPEARAHAKYVPKLSEDGFRTMKFTEKMMTDLFDWYKKEEAQFDQRVKDGTGEYEVPEPVGGGFTNDNKYPFSMVNLDYRQLVKFKAQTEMKGVLEWWTNGTQLQHTATYGVRIYPRHALLVNHVDNSATHLASAVLQLSQKVDEGWPLEVVKEDGTVCEVYLQPGEMVLYEGARLFHGRPMRFKGHHFANVFSHFKPWNWNGIDSSPLYKFEQEGGVLPHREL